MKFGLLGRRDVARLVGVAAIVGAIAAVAFASSGAAKPQAGPYVIGVSNTLVGNGWREEMICSIKAQALASGKVSKVIVANRNGGPAEQIADIRNLISAGANAIIINPSSGNALNAVIAQAAARGIQVVSVDQRVTAPQAHNVTNDQVAYGRLGAEWLFKKMGGKGNVVEMRGIAGVPADTDRHTGFQQALKKYPNIKVVKSTFMDWDFATAGKQMLDILNSGVQVDGVWNSGADYTVIQRVQDGGQAARPDRGCGQQRVPAPDARAAPEAEGRRGDEPGHDRRRGRRGRDQAARRAEGPELGQADPARLVDARLEEATSRRTTRASRAPTYSARLQIKPWTTYTTAQLTSCKGP